MAYRFTDTDKWNDKWFFELKPNEKLLFIYLCENCDIAGFIETNFRKWSTDTNINNTTIIKGALKGLERGLIYSGNNDILYIKNFLKHQKNYPLNEKNKAHLGIIKRFNFYLQQFDIKNIDDFLQGAWKGLYSPTGNGIGNGIHIGDTKYIYNKYYDEEIEISKDNEKYVQFVKILFGENNSGLKLNGVLKISNQVSFKQFELVYSEKQKNNVSLTSILENLENRPDLLKRYSTLQRVLLNWIKTNKK